MSTKNGHTHSSSEQNDNHGWNDFSNQQPLGQAEPNGWNQPDNHGPSDFAHHDNFGRLPDEVIATNTDQANASDNHQFAVHGNHWNPSHFAEQPHINWDQQHAGSGFQHDGGVDNGMEIEDAFSQALHSKNFGGEG
jgi:hypothetical protein